MSDWLPNEYWESLGQNRPFLQSLFEGQHEQLQQLKELNAFLQTQVADTCDDITNVASATASAVAQAITMNPQASIPVQTLQNPTRSAKATNPELFDGNQDQTEEFIRVIQIMVTMQANTFTDIFVHAWRHGTSLGSEWDHGSHNRDISDADIGHLSGKHQKDLQRPGSGTDSSRTASWAQDDAGNYGRGLYGLIRNACGQNWL